MAKQFANSGDPDQTLRSAVSDLGLHCLPITLLRVSRLQWVKYGMQRLIPVCMTQLHFFFFFFVTTAFITPYNNFRNNLI